MGGRRKTKARRTKGDGCGSKQRSDFSAAIRQLHQLRGMSNVQLARPSFCDIAITATTTATYAAHSCPTTLSHVELLLMWTASTQDPVENGSRAGCWRSVGMQA